jgi:hypothetical protein
MRSMGQFGSVIEYPPADREIRLSKCGSAPESLPALPWLDRPGQEGAVRYGVRVWSADPLHLEGKATVKLGSFLGLINI